MSQTSTTCEIELLIDEQPTVQPGATLPESDESPQVRSYRQLRERHWTMLIVSLVVCAMTATLTLRGSGADALVAWWGVELPPLCSSRAWFGVECPGCGLTRSFVALAAGDFRESLHHHRVGWLVALAVLLQIPYRSYQLWKLPSTRTNHWATTFEYLLIAALMGSWLLKGFSL